MSDKKIRVAIAGVGNCCQALLEGIEYYRQNPGDSRGLMNTEICGYKVTDIVPVAAFDINAEKVGKDLSEAIFVKPNRAYRYPGIKVPKYNIIVQRGPTFDGNPQHLADFVAESPDEPVDVGRVLKECGAEMLVNVIPTESPPGSPLLCRHSHQRSQDRIYQLDADPDRVRSGLSKGCC